MASRKTLYLCVYIYVFCGTISVLTLRIPSRNHEIIYPNHASQKSNFESNESPILYHDEHGLKSRESRLLVQTSVARTFHSKHLPHHKRLKRREISNITKVCENFRKAGKAAVSSCPPAYVEGLFCDGVHCTDKPSAPSSVEVHEKLNKTTGFLDFHISWKGPLFGKTFLCGFHVTVTAVSGSHFGSNCYQIHSKTQLSHVVHGISFNTRYNVTVTSLPAYKDLDHSIAFLEKKTPGECTFYKQHNIVLPWKCELPPYIKTSECTNGTVNVSLPNPVNSSFDYFHVFVMLGAPEVTHDYTPFDGSFPKTKQQALINKLQPGIKYVASVYFEKKSHTVTHITSKPFKCTGEATIVQTSDCLNGTIHVSWNKVDIYGKVWYKSALFLQREDGQRLKGTEQTTDNTSVTINGLERGNWYIVEISVIIREEKQYVIGESSSKRFSCGDPRPPQPLLPLSQQSTSTSDNLLLLSQQSTSTSDNLLLLSQQSTSTSDNLLPLSQQSTSTSDNSVLLLYPSGCKCMTPFLLILAKALKSIGCEVYLDMCNTLQAAEQGGTNMFNENKIIEANNVIMIFYEDANDKSWDIFVGQVDGILKRIVERKDASSKYIPVSFGGNHGKTWEKVVARTDHIESLNSRDMFIRLFSKCTKTEAHDNSKDMPVKNIPDVSEELMVQLQKLSANIKSTIHPDCKKSECKRGRDDKNVEDGSQYDSFNNLEFQEGLRNDINEMLIQNEFEMA
eukprot:gene7159-7966_t